MVTLTFGDMLTLLTMLGGFSVVIFAAGKFTSRLESLEEWRRAMPHELDKIHEAIREMGRTLKGSGV